MSVYVARRLAQSLIVLLGISVVVFIILHLTGDPTMLMLPLDASAEEIARFRARWASTTPCGAVLALPPGRAPGQLRQLDSPRRAGPGVFERMPATLELTAVALGVALLLAIPAGILSALSRNTPLDYVSTVTALVGQAMPTFWLGIMFILVFSVGFQVLPSSGRGGFTHLILPALTLGLFTTARTMRLTRLGPPRGPRAGLRPHRPGQGRGRARGGVGAALRNAGDPRHHHRGTRARNAPGRSGHRGDDLRVARRRPALGPGHLQPGLSARAGLVFVLASIFVLVNLAVDLVYTLLDPRIRLG